ncbi:MAG: transposase [Nitrososphaerota archaeon]
MRSKHFVDEKFQIVIEALTENTTHLDISRRHGIFPTQLTKWREHFIESGKRGLSDKHQQSKKEEIDELKRMIGYQASDEHF